MPKIIHPANEGYPIFITTACHDSSPFFKTTQAAELVIEQIDRLRNNGAWWVSGYVIMPEHVHLLALPRRPLGYCMQEFKKSVARLLHRHHQAMNAKVWLDEYHARVILGDLEYSGKVQYIWLNPVKRELVQKPEDYPFSSANPSRKTDRDKFY